MSSSILFFGLSPTSTIEIIQEVHWLWLAPIPTLFPSPHFGDRMGWWMAQLEEKYKLNKAQETGLFLYKHELAIVRQKLLTRLKKLES